MDRCPKPPVRIRVQYYEVRVWKLNEMKLPGMEVDYERWEVSFERKKIYSLFFREELRIQNPYRLQPIILM